MITSFQLRNPYISRLAAFLRKYDKENGYFNSFGNTRDLAKALYDLNVHALKIQTEDYQDYIVPFEFTGEVFPNTTKGIVQAYMTLSCLLTQCYSARHAELYQKLEKFETYLAKKIAHMWGERLGAIWD